MVAYLGPNQAVIVSNSMWVVKFGSFRLFMSANSIPQGNKLLTERRDGLLLPQRAARCFTMPDMCQEMNHAVAPQLLKCQALRSNPGDTEYRLILLSLCGFMVLMRLVTSYDPSSSIHLLDAPNPPQPAPHPRAASPLHHHAPSPAPPPAPQPLPLLHPLRPNPHQLIPPQHAPL